MQAGEEAHLQVSYYDDDGDGVEAISSDLYRPQSQDEIVEFSFFVALSYEYNLQLGCL